MVVLLFLFPRTDVSAGQKYIQDQEKAETDTLVKKLAKIRKEEIKKAQEEGTLNPFALFNDYVIFGDSRVMGFSSFGYLETSRVFAGTGHTINNIPEWEEQIKTIRPSNLYFSYGVNDMGLDVDSQEGGYDGVYETNIKKMLEYCPNGATVYVNSILPATPEAVEKSPAWEQVDDYNKKIKDMCQRNDWIYIDNDDITKNGTAENVYETDGVHFLSVFYPIWAMNMNEESI
ncbi:MAG: hypothetical protein J6D18_04475 [Erysipelotrichaceae bacterium]|nr:hypothetical protein [Erysipelotrichaceae bacterium]